MIDLARKLSDCDEKYFGGWVIAGVEIKLHGEAVRFENNVPLAKERRCVHEAKGYNLNDELVQSLRLFLVLPKSMSVVKEMEDMADGIAELQGNSLQSNGELVFSHCFTRQEIQEYAVYTGDENIIHKGEKPLVPGICMLYVLQQQLQLKELSWKASFLSPVYADEELHVYRTEKGFTAYVKQNKAFIVKNIRKSGV